ncbi:MAG: hypothetical protein CR975_06670 [Gammaproteobacteria bacterium]|nr:MAG: hypothetical protein CR975_06670 [Gammaproteobacteria bacterium]
MEIPFLQQLANSDRILIAGAGGGFDIISGVPLYLSLVRQGKSVILANLSFSELRFSDCEEVCLGTYLINDTVTADLPYFPERYLYHWLKDKGQETDIYGFSNKIGVSPLREAYQFLAQKHHIDTLVLVDGGTDSLMFGDEAKVGTIIEDACSVLAANDCGVEKRYLAALGFGVEHDFNHYACLENISTLIKSGDYLGAFSLTANTEAGAAYVDLVDYLNEKMRFHPSIVTNNVAAAIKGEFGDYHASKRTKGTEQFISALMNLYWCFNLDGIAQRIVFADAIKSSQRMQDVIEAFVKDKETRPRRNQEKKIPLL